MYPVLLNVKLLKRQPDISTVSIDGLYNIRQPINESAVSILELCNGNNSVDEISSQLSMKYNDDYHKVYGMVNGFLAESIKVRLIKMLDKPLPDKIEINTIGNKEYWMPDALIIELTHNCPLDCRHCYLGKKQNHSMDYELLINLINDAEKCGIESIQLTGGEPLIYEYLENVISYLDQKSIKTVITTSGYISNKKLDQIMQYLKLINNQRGYVQVSIDGIEESHNIRRGNSQSYSKAINFIRKMVKNDITVHVASTITKDTLHELFELSLLLKNEGVRVHRIGGVTEMGNAKGNDYYDDEFDDDLKTEIENIKTRIMDDRYRIQGFEESYADQKINLKNCGAGYRFYKISPGFEVYPCPMYDQHIISNYNGLNFSEIIKKGSSKYSGIRWPEKSLCNSCSMLYKCNHCMAEGLRNSKCVSSCQWLNKYYQYKISNSEVV
jgi:MoaA/NifB/PqqE/SkfB family radical SAM enzyme